MSAKLSNALKIIASISAYITGAAASAPELTQKLVSACGFVAKLLSAASAEIVLLVPAWGPYLAELQLGLSFVATHGPQVVAEEQHIIGLLTATDITSLTPPSAA